MLFNSFVFFVFAAIFYTVWPLCRENPIRRWVWIGLCSSVFYGWWSWKYLPLMVFTASMDFLAGLLIYRFPKYRKLFLWGSILSNLGILATFKYSKFFYENVASFFSLFGVELNLDWPAFVLPVGISFYTFQSMSYTIDVYRGEKPTRNFLHFYSFVSLFPQLVAGPIERAHHLLDQLKTWRKATAQEEWTGFTWIVKGFFKKVVIADNLAVIVNASFGQANIYPSAPFWWITMIMFAFQIYCDFSGYTDVARGLAKFMGYDLRENFRHPYSAMGFKDFWSRWHISLSTWFRDYVYIPLGGNKKGEVRSQINMWVTMIVSGIWHGANWTFLIWGALHAFYLQVERWSRWPQKLARMRFGFVMTPILIFVSVLIAWVFFRATSLTQALAVLKSMFSDWQWSLGPMNSFLSGRILACLVIIILWEILNFLREQFAISYLPKTMKGQAILFFFMIVFCFLFFGPGQDFIYFQF